jgi:hypothetical protein
MSGLFILAFYALSNFVLVALFVAVILSNFETKKTEVEKEQAEAYDRLWNLVHRTYAWADPASERSVVVCVCLLLSLTDSLFIAGG